MLLVNQLNGFGAGGVPAVPISFTSVDTPAANTTSQTTYTFSSASFGSAASDRVIVVAFASRANTTGRTISSVTIGGVAATAGRNKPVSWFGRNDTPGTHDAPANFVGKNHRKNLQGIASYARTTQYPHQLHPTFHSPLPQQPANQTNGSPA